MEMPESVKELLLRKTEQAVLCHRNYKRQLQAACDERTQALAGMNQCQQTYDDLKAVLEAYGIRMADLETAASLIE